MNYKLIAGVLGIMCLFVGFGLGMYEWGASVAREDQAMKDREIIIQYANKIKEGVAQHDKDQIIVNSLSSKLSKLQNTHIYYSCGTSTGGGVFSERVDEAYRKLREGGSLLFRQCDQLNIDARRNNVFNTP